MKTLAALLADDPPATAPISLAEAHMIAHACVVDRTRPVNEFELREALLEIAMADFREKERTPT